jgi:hypothetical protein
MGHCHVSLHRYEVQKLGRVSYMPPFDHDNLFAIYYLHSYRPASMNVMRLVPTLLHIFEQRVKQHTASNTMFLQATIRNKIVDKSYSY